jgi:hypothetical protein
MSSNIDKETFDLDSLLDSTIDDLADTPEYRPFAAGAHTVMLSLARSEKIKAETDKLEPVINAKLKLEKTEEMVDPSEQPMEPGTETTIRFQMDNEYGQGDFKKVAGAIASHFKLKSLADVLSVAKDGIQCMVVTTNRVAKKKNQNGEFAKFTSIVELTVL